MTELADVRADEDAVQSGLTDGVLTIHLNRPQAANALRPDDRDALTELFLDANADHEVRVVVLRARGRQFCAGADVVKLADGHAKNVKRATGPMKTIMGGAQRLIASVLDCSRPVVTVVQGAAAGIGAHLAYASDLVVATDNAYFAESFVKRGLVVDGGGAYLLPRRIGMQKAKEMAFFGDKLSAQEAFDLGLVNRVVPPEDLEAAVDDYVGRLAVAPTSAVGLTKRLFNESPDVDRAGSFVTEAMAQEIQSYSLDAREGVSAFVQKRPPEFVGW
ncbi:MULTISPECIES: enoyl-CoA hydratase/isomerase family protein [Gordonia]|uniref:Enoyl-CoA hydratase-related protein n=1 Tax=Gordonia hongkongensis TaxID=1701090 RepID=A0ABT6BWQ8_9ACTN|nr:MULTISPECIES: enoyl-CoA hydratase-related protein [Gordonia]MCT1351977.1 enoyl-CoA hydratase-related protein [Gordonia sp. p3-SID1431]MDF6102373.1 enoyl-CoA hydratase-related protein [Gordonia hongkongensis]UPG67773.1 enoyl-CoA hydratase-related protein [Gordonia hongkongensis]WGJ85087.1 enoyl-CoA hydratase-related protein [Gordonia sp. SMJS1]